MYIGLSLFPGKTITAKDFEDKPLDLKLAVAMKIIDQLSNIHNKGILHLDIKGANIITNALSCPSDRLDEIKVNIIDFGISKFIAEINGRLDPAGTLPYQDPELGGTLTIPPKYENEVPEKKCYLGSDLYSLGKTFMYDMGLYELAIVYQMIDPDYKKRPSLDEVSMALKNYVAAKSDIENQEAAIRGMPNNNHEELILKVSAINKLLEQHNCCSKSYYDTLIEVLKSGDQTQLKIMMNNPMFNNLCAVTMQNFGHILNVPYENKINELLEVCKNSIPPAKECAWIILENLIKLIDKKELSSLMVKNYLVNHADFLIDAGKALGKINEFGENQHLSKLGINVYSFQKKLDAIERKFNDINSNAPKSPTSSNSSIGYSSSGSTEKRSIPKKK